MEACVESDFSGSSCRIPAQWAGVRVQCGVLFGVLPTAALTPAAHINVHRCACHMHAFVRSE